MPRQGADGVPPRPQSSGQAGAVWEEGSGVATGQLELEAVDLCRWEEAEAGGEGGGEGGVD